MKRSFLIGSMILVLAFSLCACGGDKAAGIPSRETRRLTGTYSWQDVEYILFDKDNTFEIYLSTGGEEYRLVASGSYTVSAETLCMQFDGDSWLSGTAQEYTYSLEDGKLLLKEVGQSTINVLKRYPRSAFRPQPPAVMRTQRSYLRCAITSWCRPARASRSMAAI